MKPFSLFFCFCFILFSCIQTTEKSPSVQKDSLGNDSVKKKVYVLDTAELSAYQRDKAEEAEALLVQEYRKNIPARVSSEKTAASFIVGKTWKAVDFKVKNIDEKAAQQGMTVQKIYQDQGEVLKSFEFTANEDHTLRMQKADAVSCADSRYDIDESEQQIYFTSICVMNKVSEVRTEFAVLGVNDSLLYLKYRNTAYPFDVYYIMKKQ